VPLEVSYRDEIGKVISPDRLGELPAALESLKQDSNTFRSNIRNLREKYFFNIGSSAEQGAKALVDIASNQKI
jgi:YidC/Oxa1 family membrane protein insertase